MRFPDFLVIGAMKSGTTTLCRDLEAQSKIFFPSVKEPHTLTLESVLTAEGRRNYSALFQKARPDQLCGEGSTGYTKIPQFESVPDRAHELMGSELKLIYIIREPVARTLSHHYHMYRVDQAPADPVEALRTVRPLIDVSRYAMQLEPWIERFGRDNVRVVRFESFIADRSGTVADLCEFLGIEIETDASDPDVIYNAAEDQLLPPRALRTIVGALTGSQWYKRVVHPRMPQWVRDRIKEMFYDEAKERPAPPPFEIVEDLIRELEPDLERLQEILGRDTPFWDMDRVRRKYQQLEEATESS